ncbi:MAG: hypothetical protein FJ388_10460, partial [Verrucomicrobia bacterium]|nr:hypothetical protein [Verrucomicrobiota bacterium]
MNRLTPVFGVVPIPLLLLIAALLPLHAAETGLPIIGTLGTGPAMDVAVDGGRAFVIGRGKLHVVDIREPAKPKVLGSLDGLGNTRQIAVADGVAYVTARESGLFIVDVREAQPKLVTHYDSIELATGVAIAGKVLFVAERNFGVELVDVTDAKHPRHLSTIRTGEAQSVAYHDGMLYVGVWGTSEVVTADVRDPLHPRIVSKTPLDGYGDGVAVHDGKLFAATGHHSRAPHREPNDPGYGMGHGLEVFSLADPAQPKFLGRVKFSRFYSIGFDMWDVQVVGNTAFVGDTHNGMFFVDVTKPSHPKIIARTELPKPTADSQHADFVGGFGLVKDHIYAAGGATEMHIIEAKGLAQPVREDPGAALIIRPDPAPADPHVYRPNGQVHAVATHGDVAVVACGSAGIHTVRVGEKFSLLHELPMRGVVTDVCILNDTVFAAEGTAGLSMWSLKSNGSLTELGRYQLKGKPVKYLAVPEPGRFALVQVGSSTLHIVDVSAPNQPRLVLEDTKHGLLYGHQLSDQLLGGRYAAAFWHVSGLHWYDLQGAKPVFAGQHLEGRFDPLNGIAV